MLFPDPYVALEMYRQKQADLERRAQLDRLLREGSEPGRALRDRALAALGAFLIRLGLRLRDGRADVTILPVGPRIRRSHAGSLPPTVPLHYPQPLLYLSEPIDSAGDHVNHVSRAS